MSEQKVVSPKMEILQYLSVIALESEIKTHKHMKTNLLTALKASGVMLPVRLHIATCFEDLEIKLRAYQGSVAVVSTTSDALYNNKKELNRGLYAIPLATKLLGTSIHFVVHASISSHDVHALLKQESLRPGKKHYYPRNGSHIDVVERDIPLTHTLWARRVAHAISLSLHKH